LRFEQVDLISDDLDSVIVGLNALFIGEDSEFKLLEIVEEDLHSLVHSEASLVEFLGKSSQGVGECTNFVFQHHEFVLGDSNHWWLRRSNWKSWNSGVLIREINVFGNLLLDNDLLHWLLHVHDSNLWRCWLILDNSSVMNWSHNGWRSSNGLNLLSILSSDWSSSASCHWPSLACSTLHSAVGSHWVGNASSSASLLGHESGVLFRFLIE